MRAFMAVTAVCAIALGCSVHDRPAPQERGRATDQQGFLDAFENGGLDRGVYAQGVDWDALHTPEHFLQVNPKSRSLIPPPAAQLAEIRIVVSLEGLTSRLVDPQTGFERIYPIGVGVRSAQDGRSITPTGRFSTHPDPRNGWFYIWERWVPEYFSGYPFLRIDALNHDGHATYGFHGPITSDLKRGYVSHGCIRMRGEDARELFTFAFAHPGAPVIIQQELDVALDGSIVDVDYPRYGVTGS